MSAKIVLTMTDPELRQALSEWVERHTVFKIVRYEGVDDKPGTSGFPAFSLGVEMRDRGGS